MGSVKGNGWSITWTRDGLRIDQTAPELDREVKRVFRDISVDIPAEVIRNMDGYQGGSRAKSAPLQVRTGKLAQTVSGKLLGSSAKDYAAAITAGSASVPYAGIQEFGGTIKPVRAKALRVPLPDILTAGGDVKGKYQIYERGGTYSTGDGKPTWISGRAIMIEENGRPMPIWALMASVKIPPRLGIGKTIEKSQPEIRQQLVEAVGTALRKGGA